MFDFDADAAEATRMLWEAAPTVAEQVESGVFGLYVIERGRFGVDVDAGTAYRVIVDIRDGSVTQDGKSL